MARLQKLELLSKVEEAIRVSGWTVLYLTQDKHPARYSIRRNGNRDIVKVYIWNISHGGHTRPTDEYRIQITPVEQFAPEPNARNLVLGWWDDVGVFAGWDIRQHLGALGASPSFQINEAALRKALLTGFAPYLKANDETVIAFRPDFIGTYIQFLEPLHDSGTIPAEAAVLTRLSEDPGAIDEKDIDDGVAEERKSALTSTWRSLRANDFSDRVLTAYRGRCAMCCVQLRLVDGAHILPVKEPGSTDQTANGVALCALHHRAYDRGLITFDSEFKVHMNESTIKILKAADKRDRPAVKFVKRANVLRGWKL